MQQWHIDLWYNYVFPQATNEVVTRVPEATPAEMQAAVDAASAAFPKWSQSTVLSRQQIMFKFQQLIKDNMVIGTLVQMGFEGGGQDGVERRREC